MTRLPSKQQLAKEIGQIIFDNILSCVEPDFAVVCENLSKIAAKEVLELFLSKLPELTRKKEFTGFLEKLVITDAVDLYQELLAMKNEKILT